MSDNSKMAISLIKKHIACPQCQNPYEGESRFKRLSVFNDGYFIHGECCHCGNCVLLASTIKNDDLMISGTVTELTSADVEKFIKMPAISPDEILNWHQYWLEFDGVFEKPLV